MDRKILEELAQEGSIEGTRGAGGQDAVGELIDLCDDFTTTDAGPIRERLEVLLANELVTRKGTQGRKWNLVTITDAGREALAQPEEAAAEGGGSVADEEAVLSGIRDAVTMHQEGLREALAVALSQASAAMAQRDAAVARAEAAERRAEAAEARLVTFRGTVQELLEAEVEEPSEA